MAKIINWIDLGKEHVSLRFVQEKKKPGSDKPPRTLLVMSPTKAGALMPGSPEWTICCSKEVGFRPAQTGKPILIRELTANNLRLDVIQKAFPNARYIKANMEDVRLNLETRERMTPQEIAQMAAVKIAAMVGTNALSQRVYELPVGVRFTIDSEGRRIEEDELRPGLVLRANDGNLSLCAQGFVMGLINGGHAEASDVARFVDVMYGPGSASDKPLVEKVAQAIESEMAKRLRTKFGIAGDAAYREAQNLYENSPTHQGEAKGAGAVPLPLAVAVQELVRAFGGDTQNSIYVPQLFDGAMVSMLGNYDIFTEKVDPDSREAQMRVLIPEGVKRFEREDNEKVPPHPISILNVETNTTSQFAQLRMNLEKRNPMGLTVMLVPEIHDGSDVGRADSRKRTTDFLKQLQQDYEVMSIGSLQPIMRRKMGIDSPLLAISVGRRLTKYEQRVRANTVPPRPIRQIFDWDALRTFTNDTLVEVHDAAGRKLTEEQEKALRANEGVENSYQLPYQSFSKGTGKEVELMIPRNLASATYQALQHVTDRVGNIDTYLQTAIGFTDEQFKYLAPEQVDAGALMIASIDRGNGFILGDQTGAGKGVTVALAVAYAWNRGIPVVFLTKSNNLFTDFYRDLKKTGLHEKMRPLILNHGTVIKDQFSENLDTVATGITRKEFVENHRFGLAGFDNPNIIFATYSQFNGGSDSEKSEFLKAIAPQCMIVSDEAHIASGDTSKLGEVCKQAVDTCLAPVYSSGTWLKDSRQVGYYERALPKSVDAKMVSDAMLAGGENIQEVFSAMLAADGRLIRRERDGSDLKIEAVVDTVRLPENEEIANNVSLILQGLQRLCGVTDQVGRRLTREQIAKLDLAQAHIRAALDRAAAEIFRAREGMRNGDTSQFRRSQQQETAALAIDRTLHDMNQAEAALQEGAQRRDQMVENGTNFVDQAETENEDMIAAGQNTHEFDAISTRQARDEDAEIGPELPPNQRLASINDITYEDLGFTEEQVRAIDESIANLGTSDDAQTKLQKEIKRIQRMVASVSTKTTAFGSMLFLTQRTLNVALQARFAAERAIEVIRNGQKPIIFLEQTFEKRLQEELERDTAIKNADGSYTIRPLTLKDNLRETYRSVVNMRHVNAHGELIEGTIMDSQFMASDTERAEVHAGLKELETMIEALPDDLYCSPIDTITCAIRKAGYQVGEATGRKYHVTDMQDGAWTVKLRTKEESSISYIERAFNFGEYDAIVGNKAMSTGMSLHASIDFPDQRQRVMQFIQVFSDINDYIQAIGRADRRGQVIGPLLQMLASGLPSESRIMMNHFDKLRKLLASTTSNRSSKFETGALPDLFNSVGDRSVRDYLQANPGIATRLGIEFAKYMPTHLTSQGVENEVRTEELAKHMVARLDLLPVKEGRVVYEELTANFNAVIADLDALGINPLRTNVLDYTKHESAVISNVENLLPATLNERGEVASVFDQAVELRTVVIRDTERPLSWDDALEKIEVETQRMYQQSVAQRKAGQVPDFVADLNAETLYTSKDPKVGPVLVARKILPSGLRDRIEKQFKVMQVMMKSSDAARATAGDDAPVPVVQAAAGRPAGAGEGAGDGDNVAVMELTPMQVIERRKKWMLENLQYLMPGQYVAIRNRSFNMINFDSLRGVVVGLTIPPKGRETNMARWVLHVQVPGYPEPHHYNLRDLYNNKHFTGMNEWLPGTDRIRDGLFDRTVPDMFANYMEHHTTRARYVLVGNQFRAASIAAKQHLGAGGILQLKNALPERVISLRWGLTKRDIYDAVPVELSPEAARQMFTKAYGMLNRPPRTRYNEFSSLLASSLENRGIHSSAEMKSVRSGVSMYWMPTRTSFVEAVDEGMDEAERLAERANADQDGVNLVAGIGLRVPVISFDKQVQDEFVRRVNDHLGYAAVQAMSGRAGSATVRFVIRFKDESGERDTDEEILNKINTLSTMAAEVFQVQKYFTFSSAMREIAMDSTSAQREETRLAREAQIEEERLRLQMIRMPQSEQHDEQEHDENGDDDAPGGMQNAA